MRNFILPWRFALADPGCPTHVFIRSFYKYVLELPKNAVPSQDMDETESRRVKGELAKDMDKEDMKLCFDEESSKEAFESCLEMLDSSDKVKDRPSSACVKEAGQQVRYFGPSSACASPQVPQKTSVASLAAR